MPLYDFDFVFDVTRLIDFRCKRLVCLPPLHVELLRILRRSSEIILKVNYGLTVDVKGNSLLYFPRQFVTWGLQVKSTPPLVIVFMLFLSFRRNHRLVSFMDECLGNVNHGAWLQLGQRMDLHQVSIHRFTVVLLLIFLRGKCGFLLSQRGERSHATIPICNGFGPGEVGNNISSLRIPRRGLRTLSR